MAEAREAQGKRSPCARRCLQERAHGVKKQNGKCKVGPLQPDLPITPPGHLPTPAFPAACLPAYPPACPPTRPPKMSTLPPTYPPCCLLPTHLLSRTLIKLFTPWLKMEEARNEKCCCGVVQP